MPASHAPSHALRRAARAVAEAVERRVLLAADPVISEFLALNDNGITDADGDRSDWVEIHNRGDAPADMDGWYLADGTDSDDRWRFPAVTIPPGGYLLVWASDKAPRSPGGQLHTSFKLDGDGEYLGLLRPNFTVASEFRPAFPPQQPDVSYGTGADSSTPVPLIAGSVLAKVRVPTGPGTTWTARTGFDDSSWRPGNTGFGFDLGGGGPGLGNEVEPNNDAASANEATSNFVPSAAERYHVSIRGNIGTTEDYFRIGELQAGDVLTVSMAGDSARRGTLTDPSVELLRGDPFNPESVAFDDNSGSFFDALIDRFPITATDQYYLRAWSPNGGSRTYELSAFLENAGTPPVTGGSFTNEQEVNNPASQANDASSSWRRTQYRSFTTGSVATPSDFDYYRIELNAGDLLSLNVDSTSGLDARVTVTNGAGSAVALEAGSAERAAPYDKDATISGYRVPTGGTYYVSVGTSGNTSGSYSLEMLVSSDSTPPAPPTFAEMIRTDVGGDMRNVNASAYVRVPFSYDGTALERLTLRVKYDDGFVAYLNGQEIARRNAPGATGTPPAYNAAAPTDRPRGQAFTFEEINVSAFRGALVAGAGANVLAIHGLNVSAADGDFLVLPELTGFTPAQQQPPGYFTTPTPGTANGPVTAAGLVADTKFNFDRGFYDAPFALAITTATQGAAIRYTTDGSEPTATTGTLYTGPVTVDRTTTVRAAAFREGWLPSNVDTQTYLFVNDVVNQSPSGQAPAPGWPAPGNSNGQRIDYGMDPRVVQDPAYSNEIKSSLKAIPTFSLVMDLDDLFSQTSGIYVNAQADERAWEREASLEVVYPDGSRPNYQANAGVRIRGGFSRQGSNPKHAFRFFFRDEYGDPKWQHPTFGEGAAQEFDKFDLRTFQNYAWSFGESYKALFLRDQFSRDTQLEMGQPAKRGDFYHLYINGVYWGIYNTDERAEANYGASYFGGSDEDYDTIKVDPDQGYTIEATDGTLDAWQEMYNLVNQGVSTEAQYQRLLGNNPDGTRNPAYKVHVDPDNLIDYMLVIFYGGNQDAPISWFLGNSSPNNWFGVRSRTGNEGWRFFAHDSEHTLLLDGVGNLYTDRTGPFPAGDNGVQYSNPQWLFQRLIANPTFRQRFNDRVHKHMIEPGGALTPAKAQARLERRKNEIFSAVVAESARWGDAQTGGGSPYTRNESWLFEYNRIHGEYLGQRTGIVLDQFRNQGWLADRSPPGFSQNGGTVPTGYNLTMSGAGTIYYTLDGTDPRGGNGSPSNTARQYTGAIPITKATEVRARLLTPAGWSAAREAVFATNLSAVRVTELHYHPASLTGGGYDTEDFEFIELKNTSAQAVNLKWLEFTAGVDFVFPDMQLAPGEITVIVRNREAFDWRYGTAGIRVAGTYAGDSFSNGGEPVALKDAAGTPVLSFTYGDGNAPGWYVPTDGNGYTLTVVNPLAPPAEFSTPGNWRPSRLPGGTPGREETAGPLVTAGGFQYQFVPHRITFTFDADVSQSLSTDDLLVRQHGTSLEYRASGVSYDRPTNTATFTLNAPLPNGDFRATLWGVGVRDGASRLMPGDHLFDFFSLTGDVNRDRTVNGTDFAMLAANFGRTGMTYAQGDLNGDGAVNGTDFALIAGNFGRTLPGAPSSLTALVNPVAVSAPVAPAPVAPPTPPAAPAPAPAAVSPGTTGVATPPPPRPRPARRKVAPAPAPPPRAATPAAPRRRVVRRPAIGADAGQPGS